ncbi:MAG: MMPL family transporter [Bacteroidota bacterium]|nr:MMPL family transporter [Bacteroidota bacterium]
MWTKIVRFILRNRPAILTVIGIITVFMGYKASKVQLSYEMMRMLPEKDTTYQSYVHFKQRFGEDGNVMVVGVTNPSIFKLDEFNAWYDLSNNIRKLDGIKEVVSLTRALDFGKDTVKHQFTFGPLVKKRPSSQIEVDSIRNRFLRMPFYQGLLYNSKTNACLMTITLDRKKLNDKSRITLVSEVKNLVEQYKQNRKITVHYSGLPYIRTVTTKMVKDELMLFIMLSMIVAALIMFIFFRSIKVVLTSLLVVGISITWVLGITSMFGYKITILTGVIPSLIVIIAIENCIYILNKYHWEYVSHGNKILALSRTIERIGFASLMTNTATAMGFAAFILVQNKMLSEFGVVTSVSIILEYLLTITLFPIFFSFMKPPSERHTKHLDSKLFGGITNKLVVIITHHRPKVYIASGVIILISILGLLMMKTSGKVVDDLSKKDPIYLDLRYFETNFGGVMPFEISIDTHKKNGVLKMSTIERIDELQQYIRKFPEFTKPLSLAEGIKFARQTFYSGDSSQYAIPGSQEMAFIFSYLPKTKGKGGDLLKSFIDSTKRYTRVSFQMKDMGTKEMEALLNKVKPGVDSIFEPDRYTVNITGNSVVYAEGTNFLIHNLFESVGYAVILISLLMSLMFRSVRMIMISMVPNLIPLLVTAAIMGFSGIPLKPSTLIVFSIALGISVDNAIQYLARYRHGLKISNHDIGKSAVGALREASFSMIYTSIVLVLGFSVFTISNFGGTQALGFLISTTLFVAMFFNLVVLPSLLMTLDKYAVTKAFIEEPVVEMYVNNDNHIDSDETSMIENHKQE